MTQCTQESFEFAVHFSRRVVAEFSAERLTSDGGALLVRQVDRRIGLLRRLAACFLDGRDPERIDHTLLEMVSQRVYGLALGYEDLNDHEQLRHDPLLAVLAGKRDLESPLAGKSTLNRLELSPADAAAARYHKISYVDEKIDALLVDLFLEAHAAAPERIVLDLDSTDVPLHGHQESRFFHGYYDSYCYLPLYIFAGDHLLCARLRPADQDGAAGAVEEVQRIVAQIRERWPQVEILVRADSGFCREELMGWCEAHGVDYLLGLARNPRLSSLIAAPMAEAKQQYAETGKAARVFAEFDYCTRKSWSRWRRVLAKAEFTADKENPRFVVTSLPSGDPRALYEDLYCARGEIMPKRHFLGYAGRYARRLPIAQNRILKVTENEVVYLAKDTKTKTLQESRCTPAAFVALLSPHVLDRYQHSMRYFGLLAPRTKRLTSGAVFALLGQHPRPRPPRQPWADSLRQHFGVDPLIDESGNPMHWVGRRQPEPIRTRLTAAR